MTMECPELEEDLDYLLGIEFDIRVENSVCDVALVEERWTEADSLTGWVSEWVGWRYWNPFHNEWKWDDVMRLRMWRIPNLIARAA